MDLNLEGEEGGILSTVDSIKTLTFTLIFLKVCCDALFASAEMYGLLFSSR